MVIKCPSGFLARGFLAAAVFVFAIHALSGCTPQQVPGSATNVESVSGHALEEGSGVFLVELSLQAAMLSTDEDQPLQVRFVTSRYPSSLPEPDIQAIQKPQNGIFAADESGFSYIPDSDFNGVDSFSLRAHSDGHFSAIVPIEVDVRPVNDAPGLASASLDNTSPFTVDSLKATPVGWFDVDGDPAYYQATWLVDGAPVTVDTGLSLPSNFYSKGQTVQAALTPNDGLVNGKSVFSDIAFVQNSLPIAASATLGVTNPFTDDDVSVGISGWFDADGDSEGYDFVWLVDGETVGAATSATLSSSLFSKGQTVQVIAIPNDHEDTGEPVYSNTATVQNSVLNYDSLTLVPNQIYDDTTVIALVDATDADDDNLDRHFVWRVDGVVVQEGPFGMMHAGVTDIVPGSVLSVTAMVSEGLGWTIPKSASATTLNRPPVAARYDFMPNAVSTGQDLVPRELRAAYDVDGDLITQDYTWFRNGVPQVYPAGQSSVSWADTAPGDIWNLEVQAYDAFGIGTTTSAEIEILTYAWEASKVAVGTKYACAVIVDGSVKCWRLKEKHPGLIDVSGLDSGVVDISGNSDYFCVLTSAGAVKCYSADSGPGSAGSIGNLAGGVSDVSTYWDEACALTNEGSVQCWSNGQSNAGSVQSGWESNVVDIATSNNHLCAVMINGDVECRGDNTFGKTGLASAYSGVVSGLDGAAVGVAVGWRHTCSNHDNGKVFCWGSGEYGQTGRVGEGSSHFPQEITGIFGTTSLLMVGYYHSCAINTLGQLHCWGNDAAGMLGDGNPNQHKEVPTASTFGEVFFEDISSSLYASCGVTRIGGVYCWGKLFTSSFRDETATNFETAMDVSSLEVGIDEVVADERSTCIVSKGSLYCWGGDANGELGSGPTYSNQGLPVAVTGFARSVIQVEFNPIENDVGGAVCGLDDGGVVSCWASTYTDYDLNKIVHWYWPSPVWELPANIIQFVQGRSHRCFLTSESAVQCIGSEESSVGFPGALGDGFTDSTTYVIDVGFVSVIGLGEDTIQLVSGYGHSCALSRKGEVRCWGDNTYGQIGDGTLITAHSAVPTLDLGGRAVSISAGDWHTCAVLDTGVAKCWGRNSSGELGLGYISQRVTQPSSIEGIQNKVAYLSPEGEYTCAVLIDGTATCWGRNRSCSLGDGTCQNTYVPKKVSDLDAGVVSIDTGYAHACAIVDKGFQTSVVCWGNNYHGQLGTKYNSFEPQPVRGFVE